MPRLTATSGAKSAPMHEVCAYRTVCDHQRRKLLVRQLELAEKMVPSAAIAAGLAHDFKNALTAVRLHSDLVALAAPADAPFQRNIAYIREVVAHANDLLQRLADLARPHASHAALLQVDAALREMTPILNASAGSRVTLVVDVAPCPQILIDRLELQQIVVNCVLNASQAIGRRGGTITVRAGMVDLDSAAAKVFTPLLRAGKYVQVTVSDTGRGMKPQAIRRASRPFHRSATTGWGLGTAVVHGCAMRAGGGVRISSKKGSGTCVAVALPVAQVRKQRVHKER